MDFKDAFPEDPSKSADADFDGIDDAEDTTSDRYIFDHNQFIVPNAVEHVTPSMQQGTQTIEFAAAANCSLRQPHPALMLDATADAKLIDCFVDQDIDLKRIDIKQNAIITWVYDRTGSKRFWERKSESPSSSADTSQSHFQTVARTFSASVNCSQCACE